MKQVYLWLIFALCFLMINTINIVQAQIAQLSGKIVFGWHDGYLYTKPLDTTTPPIKLGNGVRGDFPTWSPDGTKIAFDYSSDGVYSNIYVINSDGTNLTQLTHNTAISGIPKWSPDGTHIAFTSDRDGNFEIYIMNANGSAQARLTNHASQDRFAVWSPNSTQLAFISNRDGNAEIYRINIDGSNLQRLTNYSGYDGVGAWSPSSLIAFTSDRNPQDIIPQIYTMNSDGSNVQQATQELVEYAGWRWLPNGNIAFIDFLELKQYNIQTNAITTLASFPNEGVGIGTYDIFVNPSNQSITSLALINADTDTSIQTLTSGSTLNLGTLPTRNLNIRADTSESPAKVVLTLNSEIYSEDTTAPFMLAEQFIHFEAGDYTLTAIPYDEHDVPGVPMTMAFGVVQRFALNGQNCQF